MLNGDASDFQILGADAETLRAELPKASGGFGVPQQQRVIGDEADGFRQSLVGEDLISDIACGSSPGEAAFQQFFSGDDGKDDIFRGRLEPLASRTPRALR